MNIKMYKDYPSRTLGVFLLGLLIFMTGSAFSFATYTNGDFENYSRHILPALLCLTGIIIIHQALFRRTVLITDKEGIIFSYLGSNHKVPWSEIDAMELVTLNHLSPRLNSPSKPNFLFTFLAVFLKPNSTYKLPRQRYWRMRKHPAIKILGREADAYIPAYRIKLYGPKFKLQEAAFGQQNINKIEAENNANEILKELKTFKQSNVL